MSLLDSSLLDKVFAENGGNEEAFHAVMQIVLDGNAAVREELVHGFTEVLNKTVEKNRHAVSRVEALMLIEIMKEALDRSELK